MFFIVGLVAALCVVVRVPLTRMAHGGTSANLGWMSEQWLAEHRASHAL